jgi:hypothetical protein
VEAYQRLTEARAAAVRKIQATTLPQPAKEDLVNALQPPRALHRGGRRHRDQGRARSRRAPAEALGVDVGKVKLAVGEIQVEDRSIKVARMLDAFFNPGGKDAEGKAYDRVHSFKECYIEITGDTRVTGRLENMDRSRLAESLGAAYREGVDTAGFSNVLGSSLTRRMVKEYNNVANYDGWR